MTADIQFVYLRREETTIRTSPRVIEVIAAYQEPVAYKEQNPRGWFIGGDVVNWRDNGDDIAFEWCPEAGQIWIECES